MSHAATGRVAAIIPAAGSGVRFGSDTPKAFIELDGISLLTRSALAMSVVADVIVVAAPDSYLNLASDLLSSIDAEIHVVAGGSSRQDSVAQALAVLSDDVTVVLIHDAARPLVPSRVTHDVVAAIRNGAHAVIPVLPITDTIKRVDERGSVIETIDRATLRRVQTPQGFSRESLNTAYADPTHIATDDAGLLETMGVTVTTVLGDERSIKITTPEDFEIALGFLGEMR
ncbi:MAG: 2-C-methyl-D-erythritol 4-phosphate cytidylyltransferase [Actinomycetes bacterium]